MLEDAESSSRPSHPPPAPAPDPVLRLPTANVSIVNSAQELQHAAENGATDIEIQSHLDLSSLERGKANAPGVKDVSLLYSDTVRSIRVRLSHSTSTCHCPSATAQLPLKSTPARRRSTCPPGHSSSNVTCTALRATYGPLGGPVACAHLIFSCCGRVYASNHFHLLMTTFPAAPSRLKTTIGQFCRAIAVTHMALTHSASRPTNTCCPSSHGSASSSSQTICSQSKLAGCG